MAEPGLSRAAAPTAGLGPIAGDSRRLIAYLDGLGTAAGEAAAAAGGFHDVYYTIAGHTVRLRFAGPALVPRLAPALAHLRTSATAAPALTVRLFDSDSTGVAPPAAPWGPDAFDGNGRVQVVLDGSVRGTFHSGTFSVYNPLHEQAVYWIRSAADVHYSETGSPLLNILHLWLSAGGVQLTHAAAVGDPDGCVLIVGHGGAGKSSTALACLSSDLQILGDDYCLLGPEDSPSVHSIYSVAKVDHGTLSRLPLLDSMVANGGRAAHEKALLLLHEHAPAKLLRQAPLRAVAVARVSGRRDTESHPVSPAAALAALAPSTLVQLVGSDRSAFARLARAVRAVPCHRLDVGTDPTQVPDVLRSLLAT